MSNECIHLRCLEKLKYDNPVILGLPWLQLHEPQISQTNGLIPQWSENCQETFLTCCGTTNPSGSHCQNRDPLGAQPDFGVC